MQSKAEIKKSLRKVLLLTMSIPVYLAGFAALAYVVINVFGYLISMAKDFDKKQKAHQAIITSIERLNPAWSVEITKEFFRNDDQACLRAEITNKVSDKRSTTYFIVDLKKIYPIEITEERAARCLTQSN